MSRLRSFRRGLEECIAQVRKAHDRTLDNWLAGCVEKYCPEAYTLVKSGKKADASLLLKERGYSIRHCPDGVYEFLQGQTVISRARFELKLWNASTET